VHRRSTQKTFCVIPDVSLGRSGTWRIRRCQVCFGTHRHHCHCHHLHLDSVGIVTATIAITTITSVVSSDAAVTAGVVAIVFDVATISGGFSKQEK